MIKRILPLTLLVMSLTLSGAFALETLTLEQVVDRVQTENSQLALLDEEIRYTVWLEDEARDTAEDLEDLVESNYGDKYLPQAKLVYVEPLKMQFELNSLERQKVTLLKTLESDAVTSYLNLINAKEGLLQARYDLMAAEKDELAKRLMLEMGRIAKIDYDKAYISLQQQSRVIASYERTIELNYIKLNALMERSASDRYEVVKPVLEVSLPQINSFEMAVVAYKENSDKLLDQVEALRIAQENYDVAEEISDNETTIIQAERAMNLESFRTLSMLRSADYDFRIAYNDLANKYDSVMTAFGRYGLSVKNYEIAKIKYERGMTTAVEFLQAASDNESARRVWQTSLNDFFSARTAFIIDFSIEEASDAVIEL